MKSGRKVYIILFVILMSLIFTILSFLFFKNQEYIMSLYKGLHKNISDNESVKPSILEISNNGKDYVQLGDYTYYREYGKESFREYGLGHNYEYTENNSKKMVKISEHGEKEELFEDTGVGEIFILNNRMYLKENDDQLYSVDFAGKNRKNYSKGNFKYVDEKNNKIIYSDLNNNIVIINSLDKEEFIIPNSEFILYDKENFIIYFCEQTNLRDNDNDTIALGAVNIDGSDKKILKNISRNDEDMLSPLEIIHIQLKDDYIYLSYGSFEGTMRAYNGSIARMKKDGTDFDILVETEIEDFLIVEKEGKDYLIFDDISMSYKSMNLSTKEMSISKEFLPRFLNIPFLEYKNRNFGSYYNDNGDYEYDLSSGDMLCSVYIDNKANKLTLIDYDDFKEIPGKLYGNDKGYRSIENIQYTNGYVYFTIEEGIRSEENDVGWRYAYKRTKTQVYQKNLKTLKIKIINSY